MKIISNVVQRAPKDVHTPVEFRVHFSAADARDVNTTSLNYLSLDRISPVLDAMTPSHASSQVRTLPTVKRVGTSGAGTNF